mmetsp:Transcript_18936/g.26063  ORF Transcript_18936/g.26063 Transcript_18936/m.26063 type:complete len:250 (-) Transcript_18936:421-1170(-)|eukprot:CAMPEP_0185727516 /NCGR_PEP_ID=MMETSP1171-20130828/3174_1 /TAXON_ID=374046 /ORGANISM="Helicotheca tamensis, Strain CCMP826" /LENGTH=249 /DNA_ID=CAMNT_0028396099 /DNA_START=107 /DNA_END=856 /DNA_ORIENTATION=+
MPSTKLLFEEDGITLSSYPSGVLILILNRGPNLFNPSFVASLSSAIAIVEEASHPKSLVITGGENNKFFSNGLDTEWMLQHPKETSTMIETGWKLLARILVMDCRTVAAINGHAFGAGLFLALACDFRIMRTKRGWLNFPELNLGMRLAKGFAELSKAKLSAPTLREGVLTGKRYTSAEALQAGMIDEEVPLEELRERAMELAENGFAENLGVSNFDPESFRMMKIELYTDAYRTLTSGRVDATPQSRL